jgi:hypothetical protein
MKERFKINVEKNKSLTYMLPFLNAQVGFKFNELILNSYLSSEEGDDVFCVMYNWSSNPDFLKFEGEMMKHNLFISHKDYGDKVVYKFRLSRHMKMGKDLFIQGKYDEFSEDHKNSINDWLKIVNAGNIFRINQILNKDSQLYSTPPNLTSETLSNNIKEFRIKIETFKD